MKESRKKAQTGAENSAGRKPYVKPRCISEPIYETLALACSKAPGQSAVCNGAPKRS
jgi:hypothetical protein